MSSSGQTTWAASDAAGAVLCDGLIIGRSADAEFVVGDPSVSRKHLRISRDETGWVAEDLGSRAGSYANGKLFQRHPLVWGDVLRMGDASFRFDGLRLSPIRTGSLGARLAAGELRKSAGTTPILDGISVEIAPGEFVGVIGPSGAGKSSFLDALCGLRPADSGAVLVDGRPLYGHLEILRDEFGYVPQDDIVPLELTVRAALDFSTRLRLPSGVPASERRRLVRSVAEQLGLTERLDTRVGRLSGGQRKRVSVAAELLARPRLLFLDEPTSGLDPASEFLLMEQLRALAGNGCTVVCTTHVLENAHLMDRLLILSAGRLVFDGPPSEACAAFGVSRLVDVYVQIRSGFAAVLRSPSQPSRSEFEAAVPRASATARRVRRGSAFSILLLREWAILRADWKNLLLLLGQPVLIALLVTWVSHDASLILFFAVIATLWFGCGNAAQEIVKELPMYRRERLVGLGRTTYLAAKFVSLARVTVVQALLMYGCMQVGAGGIGGAVGWQIPALIGTALAAVPIGLAISSVSRSILQAVMWVPLILIPQILFSGFVPPAGDMKPGPRWVSLAMPSAAARQVMDVSVLWQRPISGSLRVDFPSAFANLNQDRSLRNGQVFQKAEAGWSGMVRLGVWTVIAGMAAWFGLKRRERI